MRSHDLSSRAIILTHQALSFGHYGVSVRAHWAEIERKKIDPPGGHFGNLGSFWDQDRRNIVSFFIDASFIAPFVLLKAPKISQILEPMATLGPMLHLLPHLTHYGYQLWFPKGMQITPYGLGR